MDLPLHMRFRHLKKASREAVGVYRYKHFLFKPKLVGLRNEKHASLLHTIICILCIACRSAIHGRGLFCRKNIDAGEMVIEYSGNVIRSVLTDKREKYYDSKVEI